MTFREFRELLHSDIIRFATHVGIPQPLSLKKKVSIFLMPSIQAILLYRFGRYLYLRGWIAVPRLLYSLNIMLWGTDIPPTTRIGRSLYMPHPVGMTIFGVLGDNCTCYTQAGVGGGSGDESDIGAGPGLPVLGDGIMLGARSTIVGPVRIGSGSMISAHAFVTYDVPENSMVVVPATALA